MRRLSLIVALWLSVGLVHAADLIPPQPRQEPRQEARGPCPHVSKKVVVMAPQECWERWLEEDIKRFERKLGTWQRQRRK